MDVKREIKEIDVDFITDSLDNREFTSLNSGQISFAFRLKSDIYDVVIKFGDKSNPYLKSENVFFGKYTKDVSSSKRHDLEQEKIIQLYKSGFNVVEPATSQYLSGLVLTQYNSAINFGLHPNPKKGDYLRTITNLNHLHQNAVYHGDPNLNNIFYDEHLTWFDFDTVLEDYVDFDTACGRDLRINLLSMLKITDDSELVKACFNNYGDKNPKDSLISELENFEPHFAQGYMNAGFGNPVRLKEILKGEK